MKRQRFVCGLFMLTLLWSHLALANENLILVKDINPGTMSSHLWQLTDVGGTLFFDSWIEPINGGELWKSDGTADGTALVKDINPGSASSQPLFLTDVGGMLYFSAYTPENGWELWKSDGTTEGTVLVKDICPGSESSLYPGGAGYLTDVGGVLYFCAWFPGIGYELWKSDGTAEGTVLVKDINPGAGDSYPNWLTKVGGTLYFSATGGLWKSDGTEEGTVLVKEICLEYLTAVGGTLFFSGPGGLWKSNGTEEGTILVKGDIACNNLANAKGALFFSGFTPENGWELWKSDGTTAGTILVKDINPGADSSWPFCPTDVGGMLYFSPYTPENGWELWKSDGTAEGTVLVKDIWPGPDSSDPDSLTYLGGTLYFGAATSATGYELWKLSLNHSPLAADDTAMTNEDTAVTIDVLANDSDPDGNALTITDVTQGGHGTIEITPTGKKVIYTPKPSFKGTDSFAYGISDGRGGTATGGVTITVIPAVKEIEAWGVNPFYLPVSKRSVYQAVAGGFEHSLALKSNGTVVAWGQNNYDQCTIPADMNGIIAIGASTWRSVAVKGRSIANRPPQANADSIATNEDMAVTIDVLANDSDPDGDSLTVTEITQGVHGTVAIATDGKTVTYTPNANYNGSDSFAYSICDVRGRTAVGGVTVTVNPVNDAPIAQTESYTTDEDTPLTIVAPGVLGNDSDVDGDVLTAAVVTGPSHGTLTINPDGSFSYNPAADYNGTDSFTYKANDGGLDGNVATVAIAIAPVNDPPVLDSVTVPPAPAPVNNAMAFTAQASDVDNDMLIATWIWGDGTEETMSVPADQAFGRTHAYSAAGVYTVVLRVSDGMVEVVAPAETYVVIYDAAAGFVTGGGWINSPAGACIADPNMTGKATFGFVSRYQKGATVPTGQTEFQFKAGGLNFHSDAYEWLVVAGAKGMYKGVGTINGAGSFGFMLSAIDGALPGGGGTDKFRIKIWDKAKGDSVAYDNQLGADESADPTTAIAGGSIVIQQ